VNNNELYLQYRQAVQLIRVGRYEESFNILKEIDAERPETKNVLYALAVCCEALGKHDEAVDLCERLIARYDHPKARIIKANIEKVLAAAETPKAGPAAPPLPPLPPPSKREEDIPLAVPANAPEAQESSDKKSWLWGLGKKS